MAEIEWLPDRPKDADFATRVEDIVHVTLGRGAVGKVTLLLDGGHGVRVRPSRVVPAPAVWDTCGEAVRVDDGLVEVLRAFGIAAT